MIAVDGLEEQQPLDRSDEQSGVSRPFSGAGESRVSSRVWKPSAIDGVDFYVGDDELGHLHLDGSIHLATSPTLGAQMVAEGLGRPFRYAHGWADARVDRFGQQGAVRLFRRNYERLRPRQP